MTDWSIIEKPGVVEVAERAARKIAEDYPHTIEFEDATQEAYIFLATRPDLREGLELGLGVLYVRLLRDLMDSVETEGKRRSGHVSRERLIEGETE